MDVTLTDTLVRLASIGTSGISVLAIFWIGLIIRNSGKNSSVEWHKTVRFYMVTCLACALLAGISGVANAMFNMDKVVKVEKSKKVVDIQLAKTTRTLIKTKKATELLVSSPAWRQLNLATANSTELTNSLNTLETLSNTRVIELNPQILRAIEGERIQ